MTTDWVKELAWVSKYYGFVPNRETRAENLEHNKPLDGLGPKWLKAHNALDYLTATDPKSINSLSEGDFKRSVQSLSAIGGVLYNAGYTHILVSDEINKEIDSRKNSKYRAVGHHKPRYRAAITSAITESISDDNTVEDVVKHEAGHGFSSAATIANALIPLLRQDIENNGINIPTSPDIEGLPEELDGIARRARQASSRGYASSNPSLLFAHELIRYTELHPHFPLATQFLNDIGAFMEDGPKLTSKISAHPVITAAYADDIRNIINGDGPEGVRFEIREKDFRGEIQDRAVLVINTSDGERIIDIDHYTPEEFEENFIGGEFDGLWDAREEAFAEVYEEIANGIQEKDMAHYFPNLAREVTAIVKATEYLASLEVAKNPAPLITHGHSGPS